MNKDFTYELDNSVLDLPGLKSKPKLDVRLKRFKQQADFISLGLFTTATLYTLYIKDQLHVRYHTSLLIRQNVYANEMQVCNISEDYS